MSMKEYGEEWIPCSERMPKAHEYMKVWITIIYPSGRCTRKATWNGWCFEWPNGKYININRDNVIAWKKYSAPEPYKPIG